MTKASKIRTEDGTPAVVMTTFKPPHQLQLCKVRSTETSRGTVVGRHLRANELNHQVDGTVHWADIRPV